MGPLDGIKVIDLSPTRVGAQVSLFLADFGADVVWVEPPGGASLRRRPGFDYFARGKRSVVLDLHDQGDVGTLLDLAGGADVLIETFRPGVADRLGVGFDAVAARNPGLVYASVSAWGQQGPFRDVPGYEALVMAKLGVMNEFRRMHPDRNPTYQTVPWASFGASMTALHGVLAALLERERSGRGQRVEASLVQGFAALDTWNWFVRLINERYPDAYAAAESFDDRGRPLSYMIPMLLLPLTKDGRWLQFAQVAPRLFEALLVRLGMGSVITDPKWADMVHLSPDDRYDLWGDMLTAASDKTLAEWEAIFDVDANVFAEQFRNGPEVLDHPQLVADGYVATVDGVRMPGPMFKLAGLDDAATTRTPPTLGDARPADLGWVTPSATTPGPGPTEPAELPLAGVTILDLAQLFAAPFGATLLGDLGARIIKVETLEGDTVRGMAVFPEAGGAKVMQGKESIQIDTRSPEGLQIVYQLVTRADLVLHGFRAGVADRVGLGYEKLRELNPDVVYVHAAGYGDGPPNGHRPAYAPSIAAAGGLARANIGTSVPEKPGLALDEIRDGSRRLSAAAVVANAQADGFAALGVAAANLLGLLARARTGGSQAISSSMLATVSGAMAEQVVDNPHGPTPVLADDEFRGLAARYRMYDAADGFVFLAAPQEREWPRLVAALGPYVDLEGDARFADASARRQNDAALTAALAPVFGQRAKASWERDLLAAGVGCVAVSTDVIESTMWSDDLGRPSGWVVDVEHPTFDQHPRLAPLVRFSRSRTQAKPGVLAGAHTDAILAELGYSAEQVADLRARRVVG